MRYGSEMMWTNPRKKTCGNGRYIAEQLVSTSFIFCCIITLGSSALRRDVRNFLCAALRVPESHEQLFNFIDTAFEHSEVCPTMLDVVSNASLHDK